MNRKPCALLKLENPLAKNGASLEVRLTQPAAASICRANKKFNAALLALSIVVLSAQSALAACNCDTVKVPSPAPEGMGRDTGEQFYHSAEYGREFDAAIADAKKFCINFKKEHPNAKLAVVSDIDETLLNNEPMLKDHDKIDTEAFWDWVNTSKAPKLRKTADFIAWARKNGYSIFLVTGRFEKYRPHTIVNLRDQGIAYDGLYLRPTGQTIPAEDYKTEVRKSIEAMGFTIAENIGDQFSDLAGGHSANCTKLPNKFYFIP
jgi:hypothetical protein